MQNGGSHDYKNGDIARLYAYVYFDSAQSKRIKDNRENQREKSSNDF